MRTYKQGSISNRGITLNWKEVVRYNKIIRIFKLSLEYKQEGIYSI